MLGLGIPHDQGHREPQSGTSFRTVPSIALTTLCGTRARRRPARWHYVGETANEKKRMSRYGADGSPLSKMINYHLRQEWLIYYHAVPARRKKARSECRTTCSGSGSTIGTVWEI